MEGMREQFYGNTVLEWLTAMAVVVAALLVGKLVY